MALLSTCIVLYVLILSLCSSSVDAQTNGCKTMVFKEDFDHRIFNHHVFKEMITIDDSNCRIQCYRESRCISYNFHTSKAERPYRCELSDSDHDMHPEDLVIKYGVIYSHVQNDCNCTCKNMVCMINFIDGSHRCKCKPGFTGQYCEININDCIPNPCLNDGTCMDLANGYNCSCMHNYTGHNCSVFTNWMPPRNVPICIGAKGDKYGTFKITQAGYVRTFKLVHQSGGVSYMGERNQGNWGTTVFGSTNIEILITYENGTVLAPPPQKTKFINFLGQMGYQLKNQTNMSAELVFPHFEHPLKVLVGQRFRIWFGEDLTNRFEFDNYGTTCALLYVMYA